MAPPPRPSLLSFLAVGALLIAVLVVGYFIGLHGPVPSALAPGPLAATEPLALEPTAVQPRADLGDGEGAVIELYERCSPSVVFVSPMREQRVYDTPFSYSTEEIPLGAGSGFIWDTAGHIVTNYHVVRDSQVALVTLTNGKSFKATNHLLYPDKDLAVLKIDAPDEELRPIAVGSSHDLRVGQTVFAIGNPYGLDTTLTHGIISALGRDIRSFNDRSIHDVIQTDAAINPGNSGGPLLDSAGRLIGVNTQILSPSGTSAGVGFAVPVDDVKRLVDELVATGRVSRPGLGVTTLTNTHIVNYRIKGVPIREVPLESAAARAGLRGMQHGNEGWFLGDVILKIGDDETLTTGELRDALERHAIGDTVEVTVVREGELVTVPVTLQAIG